MRRRKDEQTGIENSEQDYKGDVSLDTADEDDSDRKSPGDEVNAYIGVESRIQ